MAIRSIFWLLFFASILSAWSWLYFMAVSMDIDLIGRLGPDGQMMAAMNPNMEMDMPMTGWNMLFAMWAIMMAAMMLPVMVPTLTTYDSLILSANGTRLTWFGIFVGYFIIWIVFAAIIAILQLVLLFSGLIDMYGIAKSPIFACGILTCVGLFQFSRTKQVCHGICLSPLAYFMKNWVLGLFGGIRMGVGLGVYCVCCCWGFMMLGFVGGVMNLLWMGLATIFMILEKIPQVGRALTKPLGFVLILGAVVLASDHYFGGTYKWR
ncbi:MAG: DUF2182 domain-containing protein [Aestuariivita sp.]|nr:DUF2182 domain-containing protein [Aestuariivita sp.]